MGESQVDSACPNFPHLPHLTPSYFRTDLQLHSEFVDFEVFQPRGGHEGELMYRHCHCLKDRRLVHCLPSPHRERESRWRTYDDIHRSKKMPSYMFEDCPCQKEWQRLHESMEYQLTPIRGRYMSRTSI